MLAAGLWVAKGRPTTGRPESTIALSEAAAAGTRHELLGPDWLARWERSQARYPADVGEAEREEFDTAVRRHPQF
jgi:queuine tRNA-ribosyltransferase